MRARSTIFVAIATIGLLASPLPASAATVTGGGADEPTIR